VELTDAGRHAYREFTQIFKQYTELQKELPMMQPGYGDVLRIGVPNFAIHDWLGDIPHRFNESYPDIKLSFHTDEPDKCVAALLARDIDICFARQQPFEGGEHLKFHRLFKEPVFVLLPKLHPLAERDFVTADDIKDETILLVEGRYHHFFWKLLHDYFRNSDVKPPAPILLNRLETVQLEVSRGNGITACSWHIRHIVTDDLAYVPLKDCGNYVNFAWRKDCTNKAIPLLIEVYKGFQAPAISSS